MPAVRSTETRRRRRPLLGSRKYSRAAPTAAPDATPSMVSLLVRAFRRINVDVLIPFRRVNVGVLIVDLLGDSFRRSRKRRWRRWLRRVGVRHRRLRWLARWWWGRVGDWLEHRELCRPFGAIRNVVSPGRV